MSQQHSSSIVSQTVQKSSRLESPALQFTLLCLLFFVLIFDWSISDLWFDEVMTLQLYVIPSDNLWQVFRNYSEANNHFLNSAITWLTLPFISTTLIEFFLRLPSILFGIATLAIAYFGWRPYLPARRRLAASALLAFSPVFCSFAYQMRGYSIGMFLGISSITLAMAIGTAAHYSLEKQVLAFLCGLLLPFAAPTSAMAAMPAALTIFYYRKKQTCSFAQCVLPALPGAIGTALGLGYYGTLWNAFCEASISAGGWDSHLLVALHLFLVIVLHGLLFLSPRLFHKSEKAYRKPLVSNQGLILLFFHLLTIAVVLLATLLFTTKAPFPRIFTVLMPGLIFAIAQCQEKPCFWDYCKPALTLTCFLLWGFAIIKATDTLTSLELKTGKIPQNLLQQYYRGSNDCRYAADQLISLNDSRAVVLVPPVDEFTLLYWRLIPPEKQDKLILIPAQRLTDKTPLPPGRYTWYALAFNDQEAQHRLATLKNLQTNLQPLLPVPEPMPNTLFRDHALYRLSQP